MRCLLCSHGPDRTGSKRVLDYGIYERGGVEVLICTRHQPLSDRQLRLLEAELPEVED